MRHPFAQRRPQPRHRQSETPCLLRAHARASAGVDLTLLDLQLSTPLLPSYLLHCPLSQLQLYHSAVSSSPEIFAHFGAARKGRSATLSVAECTKANTSKHV